MDTWVLSTHQVEFYVADADQVHKLTKLVFYCLLLDGVGLNVCKNVKCVMNNCDGVEEAVSTLLMLCPTCMQKLHLRGHIGNMPA